MVTIARYRLCAGDEELLDGIVGVILQAERKQI